MVPLWASMLPYMIGKEGWGKYSSILLFHEHCAVHVLDPAPCLVHMASTLDLLTRHCSVGFQRERHH